MTVPLGIQGASNLEPLLLACEALLLSNDVSAALELYENRFQKGRAFLAGGLPKEGKRFYDVFERFAVEHPDALAVAQGFSATGRATRFDAIHFRNGAILFDILLGELADAEQLIMVQLNKTAGSRRAITYNHQALLAFCRGEYAIAAQVAASAIRVTVQTEPTGTTALIHAQAYFIWVKALVLLGLDQEVDQANKALQALRNEIDLTDGQILLELAHLWISSRGNGVGCSRVAKRVRSMASELEEDHLALEARLAAARWFILDNRPERFAGSLISEVYNHAVEQSYPYPMISAQIMREYHAYRLGKPCSANALKQAASLAEASHMYGLQVEAIWVQSLLEDDTEVHAAMCRQIELLINRLSYVALSKTYPARNPD